MKLKQLEGLLQSIESFPNPNWELEQYPTEGSVAAYMLYTIHQTYDDIEGKFVVDLGCGPGVLGIGSQLLGAGYTLGIDVDPSVIAVAQKNCEDLEVDMDFLLTDVTKLQLHTLRNFANNNDTQNNSTSDDSTDKYVDTVIMNPPFGTKKRKGVDMVFLKKAIDMARVAVYSIHKTATREHIQKKAEEWGVRLDVVAELRCPIANMYKFHKKQTVDVEVDLLRFETAP
mmetsp:Transcript_6992/g.9663  ORF Transcript_6992/g.9663 Transcript_6992/m.9663 type:complete len:228 (-) Transcript_6992:86-769(-)|eukprot:CAMPEP_0168540820 /NCGR_PEP_ID=MMETSP0413-20121227/483_1 /TAXON_ID=136452 /ORGANISM="Filamoeba nolandi, Strain NC-AS-23-1" /LENGTH=227 /DNA_ID=CAMNT_0008570585 /DNA_START=21 /DNA_END=704 /DNA_ORIENTATION=+